MKRRDPGLDVVCWQMMPEKKRRYPGRSTKAGFHRCLPVLGCWRQRQGEVETGALLA